MPQSRGYDASAITRAFENDPRTRIAQNLREANSGRPVAAGKWGTYEAIARALGSIGGAFIERKAIKEREAGENEVSAAIARALAGTAAAGPANGGTGAGSPPQPMPPIAPTQNPPMAGPVPSPVAPAAPPIVPQGAPGPAGAPPAPPGPPMPPEAAQAPPGLPAAPVGVSEPAMPEAPIDDSPSQARSMQIAQALMGSKNKYARMAAKDWLERGISDQDQLDNVRGERRYEARKSVYDAGVQDVFAARGDNRRSVLTRQENKAQFEEGLAKLEKEYGYNMSLEERRQAGENYRQGRSINASFALAHLNNNAELQRTFAQIEAAKGTAAEKAEAKRNAFLNTATGAKLWAKSNETQQNNDQMIGDLETFIDINSRQGTGGARSVIPEWMQSSVNSNIADMAAITNKIAPLIRQVGSGAMSDKDLATFKRSIPNVDLPGTANGDISRRLIRGLKRQNDFERNQMEAVASGNQVQFRKDWDKFKGQVSISTPLTFEEWKSLPKFDKRGNRIN